MGQWQRQAGPLSPSSTFPPSLAVSLSLSLFAQPAGTSNSKRKRGLFDLSFLFSFPLVAFLLPVAPPRASLARQFRVGGSD